jgi:hypothetical protein
MDSCCRTSKQGLYFSVTRTARMHLSTVAALRHNAALHKRRRRTSGRSRWARGPTSHPHLGILDGMCTRNRPSKATVQAGVKQRFRSSRWVQRPLTGGPRTLLCTRAARAPPSTKLQAHWLSERRLAAGTSVSLEVHLPALRALWQSQPRTLRLRHHSGEIRTDG